MFDARRGNPQFERPAPPSSPPPPRGSLVPVFVVLAFVLVVVVGLVGLTGVAGLYILLAVAGVLGFAAMHYVLWGWWLGNKIRQQHESDEGD